MPFKAVKSVNLPAAGVVNPIVVLLITPPLIIVYWIVCDNTCGLSSHKSHSWVGLPVDGSTNRFKGMRMFELGTVAINYHPLKPLT